MKIKNTSSRNYMANLFILKAGEEAEVDETMAKILLKQEGVEEVIDMAEVEKMKAEVEKLKAEKVTTKPKATKKK